MDVFQPRHIEFRPVQWVCSATVLLWRRPLAFFVVTVLMNGVALGFRGHDANVLLSILLGPIVAAQYMGFAEAGDSPSASTVAILDRWTILRAGRLLWHGLTHLGVALSFLAVVFLGVAIGDPQALAPDRGGTLFASPTSPFGFPDMPITAALVSYWFFAMHSAMFAIPLEVYGVARPQIRPLCMAAYRLNPGPSFFIVLLLTIWMFLTAYYPLQWLSFVATPLMSSILYVIFRDVFLHRSQNAPEPVSVPVIQAHAPSSSGA
jgi:hypothetical protein